MNTEKRSKHFQSPTSLSYLPSGGGMTTRSNTCSWATSRDLDKAMAKNSDMSSAYLEKLDRDRDRRHEVKYKSLQNIPVSIREMMNPSDSNEEITVRRWVALPRTSPRQVKRNHPAHHRNARRGDPQATPRHEHPVSNHVSSDPSPRGGYHESWNSSLRDSTDSDELFGVSNVPFKCPALSTSRKKNCCIPARLDSQIALRKAMRTQIEQQRNSALTNHVNFVNSNKLSGTQLTVPSGQARPKRCHGHLTARQMTEGNIELLAILSVQEHNVPILFDEEISMDDTGD